MMFGGGLFMGFGILIMLAVVLLPVLLAAGLVAVLANKK